MKTIRTCTACGEQKYLTKFHKDKRSSDGRVAQCVDCVALRVAKYRNENKKQVLAKARECYARNKHKYRKNRRRWHLENSYGITPEEFEEMVVACGNKCELCGARGQDQHYGVLVVDHNPLTGVVRGLLCRKCNTGLGHFNANIELLAKAIVYLQEVEYV